MLKRLVLILFLFTLSSVNAGEFEDALAKNQNVFLYLYTPECGYCTKFTPKYEKLSKVYDSSYGFVKVNANTQYGYNLMRKYGARYVPFVVLVKSKNGYAAQVQTACLTDTPCMDKVLGNFKK